MTTQGDAMLDKCANPTCSAKFLRLRDGKLFLAEVEAADTGRVTRHWRQFEYFWLCSSCCRTMTVTIEKGKRAQVSSLRGPAAAAQADT